MKKLLLILSLVFLTGDFYCQPKPMIDVTLQPYVDEYIAEAAERCIDVTPHINNMQYILFSNFLQYPTLGIATLDGYVVAISPYCALDKAVLRAVVFHELTHSVFNQGHTNKSKNDLMRDSAPLNFRIYDDMDYWESVLDELFEGKDNFSIFVIKSKTR